MADIVTHSILTTYFTCILWLLRLMGQVLKVHLFLIFALVVVPSPLILKGGNEINRDDIYM